MVVLGFRHALDIDHITAIDNLLRLHNTKRNSRWVGSGFSFGHMIAVVLEMILIIMVIGSITKVEQITFWGGIIGYHCIGYNRHNKCLFDEKMGKDRFSNPCQ